MVLVLLRHPGECLGAADVEQVRTGSRTHARKLV